MADITMPGGRNVRVGTITRWQKHVGDDLKPGDIIAEIMFRGDLWSGEIATDLKATEAGVLTEIVVVDGQTVPAGVTIARFDPIK
jgi:pyruvate/2-oxoglutarate dehydrogenase complex dihydrolipoamide acyltransferase (E2) component